MISWIYESIDLGIPGLVSRTTIIFTNRFYVIQGMIIGKSNIFRTQGAAALQIVIARSSNSH
jgi:hypothetical protein